MLEHDAVVCGIEGVFEVNVHYVDVLVVDFGVIHHLDDGGECVVGAAKESQAILLFAEDAAGFYVLGASVLTGRCQKFK
jgi:hypothetical protein